MDNAAAGPADFSVYAGTVSELSAQGLIFLAKKLACDGLVGPLQSAKLCAGSEFGARAREACGKIGSCGQSQRRATGGRPVVANVWKS